VTLPIVVEPTANEVTVKFADAMFGETVTDAGTKAAGFALERLTTAPPAGAVPVSATVPVADWPPVTAEGFTLTELSTVDPPAEGL
jgi:hypothetical protein